jgi:hypothetical protein
MNTNSIQNNEWIEDQDSSVAFHSQTIVMNGPFQAINFQLLLDSGVTGTFTWQATIVDDKWQTLEACGSEVKLNATGNEAAPIISLSGPWLSMSQIRISWVPSGSTGLINIVTRVVPQ